MIVEGFRSGGGQSLPFSIDFGRRPYNTVALPCECVIPFIDKNITIKLSDTEAF